MTSSDSQITNSPEPCGIAKIVDRNCRATARFVAQRKESTTLPNFNNITSDLGPLLASLSKTYQSNLSQDSDCSTFSVTIPSSDMTDHTIEFLGKEIDDLRREKDQAYWERNQLVAVLSRLFPAHLALHEEDDPNWDPEWRNIVCIHIPRIGQCAWHIKTQEKWYFSHLEFEVNDWDGHSTSKKYERLRRLQGAIVVAPYDSNPYG